MNTLVITLIIIISLAVLIFLAVKSGERYEHSDAHVHSTQYADIIREGHGPLTWFLIAAFAAVFLWTAVYLAGHAREFSNSRDEAPQLERSALMN